MGQRKNEPVGGDLEQQELELLEKTKHEGFLDEEFQKNKKAGALIAPLGGGPARYFDYTDPHPDIEEVLPLEFQPAGKVYWYYYPQNKDLPEKERIQEGDWVVAYSERGMEIARVLKKSLNDYKNQTKIDFIKDGIVRKVTPEDFQKEKVLAEKAKEAWRICEQHNRELGITMKIRKVKITLDDSKVIIYFTAPGRVDFRELIKRLAASLRRRIEMRQIGVRDTTKMLGGIGPCGMELCCRRYLHSFAPVSVKMAKDQNLSLNPTKISGNCGRLFCCLSYENPVYEEMRKELPPEESEVTERDTGRRGLVKKVNVLAGTVSIIFPSSETDSYEERIVPKEQLKHTDRDKWILLSPAIPPQKAEAGTQEPLPPFRPEKKVRREEERQQNDPPNGGTKPTPENRQKLNHPKATKEHDGGRKQ